MGSSPRGVGELGSRPVLQMREAKPGQSHCMCCVSRHRAQTRCVVSFQPRQASRGTAPLFRGRSRGPERHSAHLKTLGHRPGSAGAPSPQRVTRTSLPLALDGLLTGTPTTRATGSCLSRMPSFPRPQPRAGAGLRKAQEGRRRRGRRRRARVGRGPHAPPACAGLVPPELGPESCRVPRISCAGAEGRAEPAQDRPGLQLRRGLTLPGPGPAAVRLGWLGRAGAGGGGGEPCPVCPPALGVSDSQASSPQPPPGGP